LYQVIAGVLHKTPAMMLVVQNKKVAKKKLTREVEILTQQEAVAMIIVMVDTAF
jgi:hypothetical protein